MNKDSKTWSLGLYGAHRKVKWTKWIAKKVDSLKNQIAVPLETLQILAGADIKATLSDMRQSLPSETGASVLKMLSDSGLKVSSSSVGPWVLMPYTRNLAYILREKPFDQLKVLLNIHDSPASANQNKRAALWGLGGTGKTQIAIHYAYWLLVQEPKTSIFWVHASSEARFQESFDQIGKMLGVPGLEDPSQDSKLLVRKKLMTVAVGPWLMIVDNADDNDLMYSGPNLARYLPTCSHGRIVATTRDREIAISMATIRGAIEIPKMEPNECEQLVNIMLSTTDFDEKDKEDAKRLGQILDYLPLAISQAAAYIEVKSLDIHTYLQIYEQKKIEMLSTKFESPGREDSEVPNAVVATWKLSLESIQGKDPRAVDMLSLMAFYDRQGIPGTLLQEGIGDLSTFVEPRSILINFSLIKCNKKADTYEIHRLVHMVIRSWVHEQGQSKEDNIAKHALKIVNSAFPEDILDKWVDCVPLVPHGRAVLQYKSTFLSSDQALERASLLHKMAKYLLEAGEFSAARDMEEEAMNLRTAQCGTNHPATLACMRNLALIYQRQGRNDEAERLLVQDAETMIRLFGWEEKETLASLAQLAQLCLATNRPYAASRLFSKVIHAPSAGGRQSKMDPRRRFRILLDLATSYASEGRLRAAEESILKVMEELETTHRISDFESIRAMVDLAGVYAAQDKWDVAENLWTSATLSNQLSSVAHPLAFHAMSCLGRAYSLNNRLKEGEDLQVKVLLWSKATFGSVHVETQRAAKDLAQTYYRSGQETLARNLELEILKAGAETFKDIPVGLERRSFERLVLPLGHHRILRSLMACDLELLKKASSGLLSRDSIIVLLHGPPGSGKTTTAYASAEFSKKPIVPLLWGNIGLPIREIKDNLEFYARLSRNHKCILFLDNGDALVSFKSKGNPYLSQINSSKFAKLW
ncbi:hypothetical protein L207DRAFT_259727 [Hyaloscypha variabilis F]|uniref:NB-ARC domain-containing protein n=1 Tax=Hyaloscypha variabilis (strain UAMH 11265 / GT02V1 / F) TaxID=1149755 RepID=A0A2J6S4R3_HYAVF|nr:hypothetical protein L207DRAFT_259727 [Hyaloscypha variabilis F]